MDASIALPDDVNGAMNGMEAEAGAADETKEEDGAEDEASDELGPLLVDEAGGGGLNVGTAGSSPPRLLLWPAFSMTASFSLSLPLSFWLLCLALFRSSLSSAASSFSLRLCLPRSLLSPSLSFSFSFSLTTTAGSCRLFTAVIAPPPVPPAPKPSLRDGSKRPRSDERERGEADVALAGGVGDGSASDEMMGAGEGRFSRLVPSSGVRSSEARMRCAVCEDCSG